MTSDYPDWTDLVQIVGTNIMLPIDIQGAYIMMPVDIQAQYITLEIDIVAQSIGNIAIDIAAQTIGNLSVNLVASTVTLDVNIASVAGEVTFNIGSISGTVNVNIASVAGEVTFNIGSISGTVTVSVTGTAQIDIETQSVAVKPQAEWASQQSQDKSFTLEDTQIEAGTSSYLSYTVTSGKTLYITHLGGWLTAFTASDRDLNQICKFEIQNYTDNIYLGACGGNGGASISFPTPIAIAAGKVVRFWAGNLSYHDGAIRLCAKGYEI